VSEQRLKLTSEISAVHGRIAWDWCAALPVGSAVAVISTDDETNTETQVSSLEIARKSTRTNIKLSNRGAAMAWAGWAKSMGPNGRGPRVSGKNFLKIIFPLQWKLGHLHVGETFNRFAYWCELHKNAFGGRGRTPSGTAGGSYSAPPDTLVVIRGTGGSEGQKR